MKWYSYGLMLGCGLAYVAVLYEQPHYVGAGISLAIICAFFGELIESWEEQTNDFDE